MSNVVAFDPGRPRRGRAKPAARPALVGTPLLGLLPSWEYRLEEAGKSPNTIRSYGDTIRKLARWLEANGHPVDSEGVADEHIRAYLLAERTRTSPGTALVDYRNLRVFWRWTIKEEERTTADPMTNVDRPEVPKKAKTFFTAEQQLALLKTCAGSSFEDRRDTAILRVFMDTGVRVSGLAGLRYDAADEARTDVFLAQKRLRIRLKGGDEIWIPLGKKARAALDRYVRARARHPHADSEWFWLGVKGHGVRHMTKSGVQQMVARRGEQASIAGAHPHRFRRTFAHDYLDGGGTVDGLMAITGWSTYDMPKLYAGDLAAERARDAHERLSPGDRI